MSNARHDDRDLERLLRGERATPPADLLARLRADIPERLETRPPRPRSASGPRRGRDTWRLLSAAAAVVVALGAGVLSWSLRDDVQRAPARVAMEAESVPAETVPSPEPEMAPMTAQETAPRIRSG